MASDGTPDTATLRGVVRAVRKRLTGVERSRRYYDQPRRLNVTHYLDEDDDLPAGSHCDVRAWWLTEDELVAELNARRLGEDNRRSWERELIEYADITRGPTIIEGDETLYR